MIKNILFDLGGVIVRHHDGEPERRFREAGIDPDIYLNKYQQKGFLRELEMGALTEEEFCQRMAEVAGRDHVSYEEALYCWMGYVQDVPRWGLDRLVELRRKYHVCLLSNNNPFCMDYCHSAAFSGDGHPIDDYFDTLFCSYEMHAYKPDAEIFLRALAHDDMRPVETIFVDDSTRNIAAANALGIHGLHTPSGADWRKPLDDLLHRLNA